MPKDRRFARQVRQTVKGTAGLATRLNGIGDTLACRFNGLSRRPNGFCGLTQLSRRISARRFIFAGHSRLSGAPAKPIRWEWVGSSASALQRPERIPARPIPARPLKLVL